MSHALYIGGANDFTPILLLNFIKTFIYVDEVIFRGNEKSVIIRAIKEARENAKKSLMNLGFIPIYNRNFIDEYIKDDIHVIYYFGCRFPFECLQSIYFRDLVKQCDVLISIGTYIPHETLLYMKPGPIAFIGSTGTIYDEIYSKEDGEQELLEKERIVAYYLLDKERYGSFNYTFWDEYKPNKRILDRLKISRHTTWEEFLKEHKRRYNILHK